jgi:O-antigen/teichoic acid export membrane protein
VSPRSGRRDEPEVRADTIRGVLENATALLLAYVFPRVFTFASVVLAARVLGTEAFGAYGTAAAFAVVLSILASLGMLPLLVRDIARDPSSAPRLVRAAHAVKTVAGAVMLATLFALARALGYSADVTTAALLLGVGYWLVSYADNLNAYYQGVERMRVCTEASAAFGLISGALGALLVVTTESLVWFSGAFAVGQAASLTWLLLRAPRSVRWGAPATRADLTHLARSTLPFSAAFIALTVYYKVDVLVLESLRDATDVGLYTAAYKFVDVYHALVLVGVAAVFPRLSRAAASIGGERAGWWAASRTSELVLLISVPVASTLWLLRAPAVWIFGEAYAGSVPVLALLAPALPGLALNLYGGYVLGAARRMGWVACLYAGALVLKTVLQLALVPRLGASGTAAAVLVTELSMAVAFALVLGRVAHASPGRRPVALAASAALLAWGVAALPGASYPAWEAVVYVVGVVSLYAAGGAVSVGERRAIRGALSVRGARELPAEGVS